MTILPIVSRELRIKSRQRHTYWARTLLAGVVFLMMIFILGRLDFLSPGDVGRMMFTSTAWLLFCFCLIAGIWTTVDCLSREKREGTLGLLFLTDLKGYDVVLGKLASTTLLVFYAFLAVVPMLGMALLFGGVTKEEFLRATLVLVNTLFFSASVSMLCSALNHSEARAGSWAFLLVLFPNLGLPVLSSWLDSTRLAPTLDWLTHCFSLSHLLVLALQPDVATPYVDFFPALVSTHLLGWIMLAVASWITPRSWQERPKSSWANRIDHWRRDLSLGNPVERLRFRQKLLEINPALWLAVRSRWKARYVWAFLVLAALSWVFAWRWKREVMEGMGTCIFVSTALHFIIKFWVAREASQLLANTRRDGSMELILSTPLSIRQFVSGQLESVSRQFLGPMIAILFMDCWLLHLIIQGERGNFWLVTWCIVGSLLMLADAYALRHVGLWLGLKTQSATRGTLMALSRVIAVPWLVFLLFALMGALAGSGEAVFIFYLMIRICGDFIVTQNTRDAIEGRLSELVISTRRFAY